MLNTKLAVVTLSAAALLLSSACTKNESGAGPSGITPPGGKIVPETAASDEGGVNGGGGGTLPAKPVDTYTIFKLVQESKRDLRMYIKYELWGDNTTTSSTAEKKAYGGKETLLDVLERTNIELLMDKPCLDANGKEVDGSIHASKPDTICISAFRIAPKLIEERARVETQALIIHELSHLLGATEAEAQELQRSAAFYLEEADAKKSRSMLSELDRSVNAIDADLAAIEDKFDSMTDDELAKGMGDIQGLLSEFYKNSIDLPYSIFTAIEEQRYHFLADRFMLALWYVDGQTGTYWKEEYDRTFGDKESITYSEFQDQHYRWSRGENVYDQKVITRIHSRADIKPLLQEFYAYMRQLNGYVWNLDHNLALPSLNDPSTVPNPWEQFAGKYEVVSMNCVRNGYRPAGEENIVGFEVLRHGPAPKDLYLKRIWASGWAEDSLYNDDGGGPLVTVSGNNDSALRVDEMGSTWGDRWSKATYELSKKAQGFEMIYRLNSRDWTVTEPKEYSLECKYELKQVAN